MDYESEMRKVLIDLGLREERAVILASKLVEEEILSKEVLMSLSEGSLKELEFKIGEVTMVTKSKRWITYTFHFIHLLIFVFSSYLW